MKITKLLAAGVLVSLPAMAQAQGWYAGIDVGAARSDAEIDEYAFFGTATDRNSGDTTGIRLRGGFQFGRFFALELSYVDFGEFESHFDPDDCPNGAPGPCPVDVRTSINGTVLTAVGIVPFGEHWFLNARAGYGKMKIETQAFGATDIDGSSSNDGFHFGIGGGYRFNEHWNVLLDYSSYDQMDFGLTLSGAFGAYNQGETTMTSLGVNYSW
ncbi:MAG TPA: porin family protein [Steroidobacteraceae bacterium]